jgi:hypothetical protein
MAESDIELITRYWTTAPADYLTAMGVDINKMPSPRAMAGTTFRATKPALSSKTIILYYLVAERKTGWSLQCK